MTRHVVTVGAGRSRPLPSMGAANRKHQPQGSVKTVGKADYASVLGALLRRHKLTAESGNLAQHGSALVHVVRDQRGR